MKSVHYIDEEGLSRADHELWEHPRAAQAAPDVDLGSFGVKNWGWVELRAGGTGLEVRLRPAVVSPAALAGAFYQMMDLRPGRCVLSLFDRTWRHQVFGSFAQLRNAIETLVAGTKSKYIGRRFHAEPLGFDQLDPDLHAPMIRLVEIWKATQGVLPSDPLQPFRKARCLARVTLLTTRPPDDELVVTYRGRGLDYYADRKHAGIGATLDHQPDPAFARASGAAYAVAHRTGNPWLDTVEAAISGPDGLGRRSVYDRLILPWRTADGGTIVSGYTVVRGRVAWEASTKRRASSRSSSGRM